MGLILGTLTKLRIPTISCVMSVRLSAGPRGATRLPTVQAFMKFDIFRKSEEKVQILLNSDKLTGKFDIYFTVHH